MGRGSRAGRERTRKRPTRFHDPSGPYRDDEGGDGAEAIRFRFPIPYVASLPPRSLSQRRCRPPRCSGREGDGRCARRFARPSGRGTIDSALAGRVRSPPADRTRDIRQAGRPEVRQRRQANQGDAGSGDGSKPEWKASKPEGIVSRVERSITRPIVVAAVTYKFVTAAGDSERKN